MKKNLTLVISLIITMAMFTACENHADTYKHADNWEIPEDVLEISITDELYDYTVDLDMDLEPIKVNISETLNDYDLDWDNFADVKTVKQVSIPPDQVSRLSEELVYVLSSYEAFYDDRTGDVLILPLLLAENSEQQVYMLTHELIHALVSVNQGQKVNRLEEGLVDYLAVRVIDDLDFTCTPGYQGEQLAVEWLIAIFGEEEVIEAVRTDQLDSIIDAKTKEGMSKKLNYALALTHSGQDVETTVNVELDILAHLAKNEGKAAEVVSILTKDEVLYASVGVEVDTDYFEKLLS